MKDNGRMIKKKEMEYKNFQMDAFIKDNIWMENHQVLGATPEKMENIMRDNGAKVENMDKD